LRSLIIKIISLLKAFFFLLKPGLYLGFLASPLIFIGNSLKLSRWISEQQKNKIPFDDFFKLNRNYNDRFKLHSYVTKLENLENEKILYLEFGVAAGISFKWWLNTNKNPESNFFGFDTFEGLPEDWGIFKKGEMGSNELKIEDNRFKFIKGLFQTSLPLFIQNTKLENNVKKIIHMDADLFSSTLFVLTSLSPYLKPGDIFIFDEFCVPNHEFFAFEIFNESFNFNYEILGAVNNYLQIALKIVSNKKVVN
jgi:hypothetical protein